MHQSSESSSAATCGCGCGKPVTVGRAFAQGHYARVAKRAAGGRVLPTFQSPPCACGCGTLVKRPGRRYLMGHQPAGPGARVAARAAQGTPQQIAFGAFIRGATRAADLHAQELERALSVAYRVESGRVVEPRTIASLAQLLSVPIDELLSRAGPVAPRARGGSVPRNSETHRLVNRALAHAGLTLTDVATTLDITGETLSKWIAGRQRPQGERLAALAALLDEPALMGLLSPYLPAGKIRMHCPTCGRERKHWPSAVRKIQERSRARKQDGVSVDWEAGEGTSVCGICSSRQNGQARIERIKKREGRTGLYWLGQKLRHDRKQWIAKHPDKMASVLERLQEGRRAHTPSELDRTRQRLGMLAADPAGRFGLCRLCGKLTFFARNAITKGIALGLFHRTCAVTWSRSPEMRVWARRRQQRAQDGRPNPPAPPMPLPTLPGRRHPSPAELADAYQTTLQYLRQRAASSRALRDDYGHPISAAELASRFGITRRALYLRIERFMTLLPECAVATGRVKQWREIFTTLMEAQPVAS